MISHPFSPLRWSPGGDLQGGARGDGAGAAGGRVSAREADPEDGEYQGGRPGSGAPGVEMVGNIKKARWDLQMLVIHGYI